MEEIIETERDYDQHFSQVTKSDGSIEEFNFISAGIAFPKESIPGLILAGGMLRNTDVVKIIAEEEFHTLSEGVRVIEVFYEKLRPHGFYYQDLSENEAFGVFLKRNGSHGCLIWRAPYTENLEFGIPLINDFLFTDRLLVPKNSVISKQLQTNWENFSHEQGSLNAITALFCLLSGLINHPLDEDLESGLI